MTTVFDKILAGEMAAAKIYEDEALLAFMDAFPQSEGHALIVPKERAVSLLDISETALVRVAAFSRRLAIAQQQVLQADGIKVMQFSGQAAGQTVFYYHMHLIPVFKDKALAQHHSQAASLAELEALAAKLAQAL